jgi:Leucine-rich repeat (LRR) protein
MLNSVNQLIESEQDLLEKMYIRLKTQLPLLSHCNEDYDQKNNSYIDISNKHIVAISLANMKLNTIPEEIFEMKYLNVLNLYGNNLIRISEKMEI